MTTMIQVSPKDSLGTLYNLKSEADEPSVTWADFGALLVDIGGAELAAKVRTNIVGILAGATPAPAVSTVADPLAAARATVQAAFPGAAPVGEQWGSPPVAPMASQPYQQAAAAPAAPAGAPGPAPTCQHGTKLYKTGVSTKNNREWSAWFCPAPGNDPTQCEKQWLR